MGLQFLSSMTNQQVGDLFQSVDVVFLDIDGVVVLTKTPIKGADRCVEKLRQLGKQIGFVTNNTFSSVDVLKNNLVHCEADHHEINTPNDVVLSVLKKENFSKDIFMIGSRVLRSLLTEGGYKVIEYKDVQEEPINETFTHILELIEKALVTCKNVGVVIACYDFNFHSQAAQVATSILKRNPDILFLSGLNDDSGPLSEAHVFVGPKYYIDGIQRWSNKACIQMAKPGKLYGETLISKYGITDPSRVLFIGDNPETDIAFGKAFNFKTMLVLSGITTRDQVDNWKFPENQKPDYVADSLGEVFNRIKNF